MACIRKEIVVDVDPAVAWRALRDVSAVDRVFPGIVAGVRLEADGRIVTFANGLVVREVILDVDDERRRVAYGAVEGGRTRYHHASLEVQPDEGGRSRIVWITDVLPAEATSAVAALVEAGAAAMKQALERLGAGDGQGAAPPA